MAEDAPRGRSCTGNAGRSEQSGWIATEVAVRAVRVSPRAINCLTERDKLEAKPQGEAVRRERLVSLGSLHALRATRSTDEGVPEVDCGMKYTGSIADLVRKRAAKLESGAEVAAGLHGRLDLTERARSTLADERCQALRDLGEERERREPCPNGGARTFAWSQRRSGERENAPKAPPVLPRTRPGPRRAQAAIGGAGAGVTGRGGVGCSGVSDEEQPEREVVHGGWRESWTLEEQAGLADRYAERDPGTVDRSDAKMARDEMLKMPWRSIGRHGGTRPSRPSE